MHTIIKKITRFLVLGLLFWLPADRKIRVDRWLRGKEEFRKLKLADAVIVTGAATGSATPVDAIREARLATSCPLLVGSGVTVDTLPAILPLVDGVIVGSALKYDGVVENRVDPERVRRMAEIVHS